MRERGGHRWRRAVGAAAGIAVLGLVVAHPAWSKSRLKQRLLATGVDPDAQGQVKLVVRHRRRGFDGKLTVKGRRLDPSATYEIVVGGVRIGTLTTNRRGSGRARFRTRPRGHRDQLLGLDPRGLRLAVHDADGDDVLETDFPEEPGEPGAIRCCLPEEHPRRGHELGVECEQRKAAECEAKGGTNLGAGSCLPNPCEAIPPPPEEELVRCCIPEHDDDGPECEERTAARCSQEQGVNLGPGSCHPNPCAPTPPEESTRCCTPEQHPGDDDNGAVAECEHRSPTECAARGGLDIGPGSCHPNPCAGSPSGAFAGEVLAVF